MYIYIYLYTQTHTFFFVGVGSRGKSSLASASVATSTSPPPGMSFVISRRRQRWLLALDDSFAWEFSCIIKRLPTHRIHVCHNMVTCTIKYTPNVSIYMYIYIYHTWILWLRMIWNSHIRWLGIIWNYNNLCSTVIIHGKSPSPRRWRFEMLVWWTTYHGRLQDLTFYMHQARLSAAISGPFWWSWSRILAAWGLPKVDPEIDHFRGMTWIFQPPPNSCQGLVGGWGCSTSKSIQIIPSVWWTSQDEEFSRWRRGPEGQGMPWLGLLQKFGCTFL